MKRCILLDIRGYCLYKLKTHDLVNIKRRFLRELEVWPWNHQENQTLNTIEEGKKEERNDLVTPPSQSPVPDSSSSTSSISSPPPKKVSSLWKICESWIVAYITGAPFKYDDRMDETWTKAMIEEIRLVKKANMGACWSQKEKEIIELKLLYKIIYNKDAESKIQGATHGERIPTVTRNWF